MMRSGKTEPVSRDEMCRRERGTKIYIFSVELTMNRIGNHPYSAERADQTYIQ